MELEIENIKILSNSVLSTFSNSNNRKSINISAKIKFHQREKFKVI